MVIKKHHLQIPIRIDLIPSQTDSYMRVLQVGGLRCELQQAAAVFESQRNTAVVLDVGYGGTRVFASHNGVPLPIGRVLPLGGQDVDDYIASSLSQLGLNNLVNRSASKYDFMTQLKHDMCRVSYPIHSWDDNNEDEA